MIASLRLSPANREGGDGGVQMESQLGGVAAGWQGYVGCGLVGRCRNGDVAPVSACNFDGEGAALSAIERA